MLENKLGNIKQDTLKNMKFTMNVVYKLSIPIVIAVVAFTYAEIYLQNHPEAAKAFEEWTLYYLGH